MSISQSFQIIPPVAGDKSLNDFSRGIQLNLNTLFSAAHTHIIYTSIPSASTGANGDIAIGNVAGSTSLFVKISGSWYSIGLTKV